MRVNKNRVVRNAVKDSVFSTLSDDDKLIAERVIMNASVMRSQLLNKLIDDRRDIDDECGYPKSITTEQYSLMYNRELGGRVVAVLPEESWAMDPEIQETENPSKTEFEQAWEDLEMGKNVYYHLLNIDEISGIGRFGILLLGFNDGKALNEPIEGIDEKGEKTGEANHELLYLRAFSEANVRIEKRETDQKNPRFGQPVMYAVTFESSTAPQGNTVVKTTTSQEQLVHWSRVIHIADNRKTSLVYGIPRMQMVFNRLYDLRKIVGGSGEMFWKGAFPGYAFEVNPDLEGATLDTDSLRTEFENYSNGLQRYLALNGVTAKSLTPQPGDPTAHSDTQLKMVAISMGVPLRVFTGTERGELASSQDEKNFNRRLNRRREKYLTPLVIRPFIDRLIILGALPEPKQYVVIWPKLDELEPKDEADVLEKRASAMQKYVAGGVETLVPPEEFLTMFMGLTADEVKQIVKVVTGREEEMAASAEEEEAARLEAEELARRQAEEEAAAAGE